jgi:hypothetical protein
VSFWDRFASYPPQLQQVIVNLKSGTVFRGLIWQRRGTFLVLREVDMLSDRDSKMQPRATNGEVLVQLVDVDFIQVP